MKEHLTDPKQNMIVKFYILLPYYALPSLVFIY